MEMQKYDVYLELADYFDYSRHSTEFRNCWLEACDAVSICWICTSLVLERGDALIPIPLDQINLLQINNKIIYEREPRLYENINTYNKWRKKCGYAPHN